MAKRVVKKTVGKTATIKVGGTYKLKTRAQLIKEGWVQDEDGDLTFMGWPNYVTEEMVEVLGTEVTTTKRVGSDLGVNVGGGCFGFHKSMFVGQPAYALPKGVLAYNAVAGREVYAKKGSLTISDTTLKGEDLKVLFQAAGKALGKTVRV